MNDDLLMALKKLLEHGVGASLLAKLDKDKMSIKLPNRPDVTYVKPASTHSFRVLHEEERQQFDDEGLHYLYFLEKMIDISRNAQEQLLNALFNDDYENKITPSKVKWAMLSLAPKDLTPLEYAFLDFVLTPNLHPTQ
jgi:hypothetical protein